MASVNGVGTSNNLATVSVRIGTTKKLATTRAINLFQSRRADHTSLGESRSPAAKSKVNSADPERRRMRSSVVINEP